MTDVATGRCTRWLGNLAPIPVPRAGDRPGALGYRGSCCGGDQRRAHARLPLAGQLAVERVVSQRRARVAKRNRLQVQPGHLMRCNDWRLHLAAARP